jgi:hypothetical protein
VNYLVATLVAAAIALFGVLSLLARSDPPRHAEKPRDGEAETRRDRQQLGERMAFIRAAANGFLAFYLPYTYGRTDSVTGAANYATVGLLRELQLNRPRVDRDTTMLRPRVRELLIGEQTTGDQIEVQAIVDDGRSVYALPLLVTYAGRGWRVAKAGA